MNPLSLPLFPGAQAVAGASSPRPGQDDSGPGLEELEELLGPSQPTKVST